MKLVKVEENRKFQEPTCKVLSNIDNNKKAQEKQLSTQLPWFSLGKKQKQSIKSNTKLNLRWITMTWT